MQLRTGQRYSVLDDLFDLVLAGHATIADFVELAGALRGEDAPPVWSTVAGGFGTIAHVAPDRAQWAIVGTLWSAIARPELDRLGLDRADGESDQLINEVRAALYSSLGSLSEDTEVIDHARRVFDGSLRTDNASIDSAAVRVIASTGTRGDYAEMFERFERSTSPQIERRYLFAMTRFDDAGAIADLCERTLDGTIRSQDAAFVYNLAMANRWHGEAAWRFVTTNWDRIGEIVPDNALGQMLGGVRWLEHGDTHAEVRSFLAAHPVPQAKLATAQHLERLDVHVALRDRFPGEIAAIIAT